MHDGGTSGESHGWKRGIARVLADFVGALALVWLVTLGVSGSDIRAHAVALPVIAKEATQSEAATTARVTTVRAQRHPLVHSTAKAEGHRVQSLLLSLAFAAILACNLAFLRHLRRVYASPRRSVWRRG
jgi:hypothetical protein